MRNNDNKQTKRRLPLFRICIILIAVSVLVMGVYTAAKYTVTYKQDAPVVAASFYFESDLLAAGEIGAGNTYTLPAGTDTISFVLKNHADDLRTTDADISYEAVLSGPKSETQKGVLAGNQATDQTVCFEELSAGEYTVTAEATAPYYAKLQAKFIIPAADNSIEWSVSDSENSAVVKLTVKTNDYSGPVTITWDVDAVVPDNTDPLLAECVDTESCTISFKNNSEYTFVFFKHNQSAVYTEKDFTIE